MVDQEPDAITRDPTGMDEPPQERRNLLPVVYTPTGLIPYGPASSRGRTAMFEMLLLLSCILSLVLFALIAFLIKPPWQPVVATITITPRASSLSQIITAQAVTGSPGPGQLQARFLSATTPTYTAVALARGLGSQPARQARGQITFYNLAPFPQPIPAGTRLSARGGVQVKTLRRAVVPAGDAPVQGVVTVAAQALQGGPGGNIPAGAVSQECCADTLLEGVYAKNLAPFGGGQDAQSFRVVLQSDIDTVVPPLIEQGDQDARATLRSLVDPGEQPAGESTCTPDIKASAAAGSRAAQTTVTVTITCRVEVYDVAALEQLARTRYMAYGQALLGQAYRPGPLQLTAPHIILQDARKSTLALVLTARGTWVFQVSRSRLQRLLPRLVGQPWGKARALLLAVPGVAKVTLAGNGGYTLPTQPGNITYAIQPR
jgi:hypothetical protein